MQHLEFELQKSICRYLSYQYSEVEYMSDTIANLKLTMQQASRNKAIQKNGFKCPDLIVLEPRNGFHGLFIELKLETPFKKDGSIKASKNDHLKGQLETIQRLNDKGYFACFGVGFEQTKEIIDNYLKQ